MSQAIIKGFYDLLSGTGTGTPSVAVSARIYQNEGPMDCTLPYIVWSIIYHGEEDTFATNGATVSVQIDVYGDKNLGPKPVSDINDLIWTKLHHKTITVSGWTSSLVRCTTRGIFETEDTDIRCRSEYTFSALKT